MLELTVVVLIAVCVALGYALYRQQNQFAPLQSKLQQSEADSKKAHAQWQQAQSELGEKEGEAERQRLQQLVSRD